MKHLLTAAFTTLGLLAAQPAAAALLVGHSTPGASTVADYSADGLIAFDVDLAVTAPVRLRYELTDADLADPLDFNAVLRNLTGSGLARLFLTLSAGRFDDVGSVTRTFGGDTQLDVDGGRAAMSFDGPEYLDLFIGNPLGQTGLSDWTLDLTGLRAGDVLDITLSVPEPGSLALTLSALLALGWRVRRARG